MADQLPADMSALDLTAFDEVVEELAPGGPVIRFKNGKWVLQTEETVRLEMGQKVAVNLLDMVRGWLRFEGEGNDAKLAEKRLGKVVERYRPEARDTLGYDDKSKWKLDSNKQPMDPWASTWQFPAVLIGEKGNYAVTVAGTSSGWERSVGALITQWKAEMPTQNGKVPVIELHFREGKTKHGDRDFPHMPIVEWSDPSDFVVTPVASADTEPKEEKAQPKF
jgi:hypothetical protein